MKALTLISSNGNQMAFIFNDDDILIEFKAEPGIAKAALLWILERLPITVTELEKLSANIKAKLVPTALDLSFDTFWKEYDFKVGNKTKCEKLWNSLSDADKTVAMHKLAHYKRFVKVKGIELVYPERYISQRRFENEFK